MDLNHAFTVAKRQAFGARFVPTRLDKSQILDLQQGKLELFPHPAVNTDFPISWTSNPLNQRNWCFQLHTLRWIDPIRRLAADGDRSGMGLWDEIVEDWEQNNPVDGPVSTWAWTDMTDAMRAMTILFGLPYSRRPKELVDLLQVHGRWLNDVKNIGHSNHAMHQHVALFLVGSALQESEWIKNSEFRLKNHFRNEYDSQGLNAEGSPGYWQLNLIWSREIEKRLKLEKSTVDIDFYKLDLSLQSVIHATRPDGYLETLGDTGKEKFRSTGSPQADYVRSGGENGIAPAELSAVYRGGYAFGRTGWGEARRQFSEESFYSLVFGGYKVHGHSDYGSLTFAPRGVPLIVDSGKFSYTKHWMRDYVESHSGHNVIIIEDEKYSKESSVALEKSIHHEDYDFYSLSDYGYDDVEILRNVLFVRDLDTLVVVDYVKSSRKVSASQQWHLNPDAQIDDDGLSLGITVGGQHFSMRWVGSPLDIARVKGVEEPALGWMSPDWNEVVPTELIRAQSSGTHLRFVTVLGPGSLKVSHEHKPDTGSLDLHLRDGIAKSSYRIHGNEIAPLVNDDEVVHAFRPSGTSVEIAKSEKIVSDLRASHGLRDEKLPSVDYGYSAALQDLISPKDSQTGLVSNRFSLATGVVQLGTVAGSVPVISHDGIDDPIDPQLKAIHVYRVGPLALPALYLPGEGPIVVSFHGALDRGRTIHPRFERAASLEGLGFPALVFGDPTLDLSSGLKLGWYLGSKTHDLPESISKVVLKFASDLSLHSSQVILTGSSGGGFAALQTSTFLEGSQVVAYNPQTSVRDYFPRFSQAALEAVFGNDLTFEDIPQDRWDVGVRLRNSGNPPSIITYVSNTGDGHHVVSHADRFFSSFDQNPTSTSLVRKDVSWGAGHVGPSSEFYLEQIRRAASH